MIRNDAQITFTFRMVLFPLYFLLYRTLFISPPSGGTKGFGGQKSISLLWQTDRFLPPKDPIQSRSMRKVNSEPEGMGCQVTGFKKSVR